MDYKLSLHRLFSGSNGYLADLNVPSADECTLRVAREEIRQTLRHAFQAPEPYVERRRLFEDAALAARPDISLVTPKFRLQGSFAYHTANDCQQTPPQQIDQDDGVFLPVSFFERGLGRGAAPAIASQSYFELVEKALAPICQKKGWRLDTTKATCVRIVLSPRLHMDLPLYVIREGAFQKLATARARDMQLDEAKVLQDIELSDSIYRGLREDQILLAHREQFDGWEPSDPRRIEDWFANAVQLHGPVVRTLSRAYKGMRDSKWAKTDLSSICIMVAAVEAYGQLFAPPKNRVDIILRDVAEILSKRFAYPIENPAFPGDASKMLCKDWSPGYREEVCEVFAEIASDLEYATEQTLDKDTAVYRARLAFGQRVPNDHNLIDLIRPPEAIRQQPSQAQKQALVPRTHSG